MYQMAHLSALHGKAPNGTIGYKGLTDLTKKNAPNKVQWADNHNKTFSTLKGILCSEPILKSLDFEQEFLLQTDAFERGMLSQCDEAGIEHPVAFYSRKLLPREVRYSTI